MPRRPRVWIRVVAAGLGDSPSVRTFTLLAAAEAGQGCSCTAECTCINSSWWGGKMFQQISQPRHPFTTALQRSQSTFGLQGLDFLGKTGGLVLLLECSECVTAVDVLSLYKGGLELEIWPIHDGCSIGTRSSARMFHSRHPLLLIHNTYWYKNLMEECQPLSLLPAHHSPCCLCQPRSELWLDHQDSLGQGWEHGLYFSWAGLIVCQDWECSTLPWTQGRTAQYWGRAISTLVLPRVCRNSFFLSAWQEAVMCFQDTFSHQLPFSHLVQLVGVFEVKSVNLGKIQTPLTTGSWSSIAVQKLLSKSRYYISHYSSVTWPHDPFMRAKVF